MAAWLELYREQAIVFLLVATRLSGLALAAPVLGLRQTPKYVRALLVVALSVLIASVRWSAPRDLPEGPSGLAAAFGCEAAIGLTFGLALLLLSAGVKIAGQLIAQMSGLSLARVYDPEQHESSSLYGTLLDLAAVAVFLLVGGHRRVVAGRRRRRSSARCRSRRGSMA